MCFKLMLFSFRFLLHGNKYLIMVVALSISSHNTQTTPRKKTGQFKIPQFNGNWKIDVNE